MCWMHRWIIVAQSHLTLFDTDLYGISCTFFFCRSQWWRSPGKRGSLFHPDSDLFLPNEKGDVTVSTVCWSTMLAFLLVSAWIAGPVTVLKLYGVPYAVSVHENSIYLCLFKRLLWFLCIVVYVCLYVDLCRVLGSCDLFASPWPSWEAPLVSRKGTLILGITVTIHRLLWKCLHIHSHIWFL